MGTLEFHVRDDQRNFLAVLDKIKDRKFFCELNDVGSGQFRIHAADAKATSTNLAIGNVVDVLYDGTPIGAWIIEDIEETLVSQGEAADQWLQVSGRGMMSRLDRAIVWPADINEYDSQFEFTQVNPATLFVTLYELFVARGGTGLFPTFTYYTETGGGAWSAGNININLTVGQSLLDVTRRMMALANFDMIARYDTSLDAYNYLGSDLSATVSFRYGRDILSAKQKKAGAEIANVVLGEGIGTYLQAVDSDSVTAYGRRETHLPLRITDDTTYLLLVNNVLLGQYADAPTSIDLAAVCTTYVPGVDYNVGDTVGVAIEDRLNGTYRVQSYTLQDGPNGPGDLRVALELNSTQADYLVRVRRAIENELQGIKVTPGSTSNLAAGGSQYISGTGSITAKLFVGRTEGPHVGLWRRVRPDNDYDIYFQAVDTSNRPYMSVGGVDFQTNKRWLTIGYTDKAHIRLELPSNAVGEPEEPTDLELVGLSASGSAFVATDTIWDAKGDLSVGTGSNTASRLAVGADGYVLVADSTQATGVKWVELTEAGAMGELLLDGDSGFLYDDDGDILYADP